MDREKAKIILSYIRPNTLMANKINKALKEIQDKIINNRENCHIFRELGLIPLIIDVLNSSNERSQKWALSILSSCLLEREFQKEVHEVGGLTPIISLLKNSECRCVQHRLCRVIGQQCNYYPSCEEFHRNKASELIISFLKSAETDEEKISAVKTLRALSVTQEHQLLILKENGLHYVCDKGLSFDSEKLCLESLKFLWQFCGLSSSNYFKQLMKHTDNFQVFSKLYEKVDVNRKKYILNILLTVFKYYSSYSSVQEYQSSCMVLDYLCRAKLPYMIINKLQEKSDFTELDPDEAKLIIALCKLCELNEHWKKYSLNVLPMYYERTWMQVIEHRGITMLISALSSQKSNLSLLPSLLRGLLGLEHLHSNKVEVLYYCVEAKLLPILAEIFDTALSETSNCMGSVIKEKQCHHMVKSPKTKSKGFSKEVSKELLELVEVNTIKRSSSSEPEITPDRRSSFRKSPPKVNPTVSYKNLNKIKFRTGRRASERGSRVVMHSSREITENEVTLSSSSSSENGDKILKEADSDTDKDLRVWIEVLEYIVRFLYQVFLTKEDIAAICKQFLLKLYQYIYNSPSVHPSALKLLSVVAKNSSSIQYSMDILFIPKLKVDLIHERVKLNCKQCVEIQAEVETFLGNLRSFFNHYHQYGRCEVANRLNPAKSVDVKHSCVVSFSHVVTCPKLLHSFLLDHKGLESLMALLPPQSVSDSKMALYGIAALCSIFTSINVEYRKKYKAGCIFCYMDKVKCIDLETIGRKNQLLMLCGVNNDESTLHKSISGCRVVIEEDKNFSFYLDNRTIDVNKELLSDRNEVLRGMLQGSFSESTKNSVNIKDVNGQAMEMLIHFIYGCTCDVFLCKDVEVYVELLFLSQMYFISELQILAVHSISNLLDQDKVFSFIESRIQIIDKDLIQHLICSSMGQSVPFHTKLKWINQFLESQLGNDFKDHVSIGLTNLLVKTSFYCNCDIYRKYM